MTRYNSRPRSGRSPLQKAQVHTRTALGQFAKLSSMNTGFTTEPSVNKSSLQLDNNGKVVSIKSSSTMVNKPLKNALAREKRAKNTIQLLRERTDTLCDQFLEACKARESAEKALGNLESILDTSSAEIVKLQEQVNTLLQLTAQLSQELVAVSTELSAQMKNSKMLEHQKSVLYHSRDAMRKRLRRATLKIAKYQSQSSSQIAPAEQYLLKDSAGVIKSETRDMIRKLACEGVSTERASEVINIVAEGLGIEAVGAVSARSVARIMFEGLIAARIQLAHELEHAKSISICGDGTSIKHQQYESMSAYIQFPTQDNSISTQSINTTPVYRMLGVQRTPNHTAKQQLDSWISTIDNCCSFFASGPLGRGSHLSSKMVAPKLRGMLTDHALDQKRLCDLLREWKRRCDREARATSELAKLSVEEQLNMLTSYLDNSVGSVKDWRSLPPEHQDAVMHDAWFALAAHIGEEEFQKMSPEMQFDVDFLAWAGCCMHKELNAAKAGVSRMASKWKELDLVPPIALPNKYEAQKSQDRMDGNLSRGAIKVLDLLGALFHNKDEKKGYHSVVDAFFQNEFGYSKKFPATNHTRFGSHYDAAIEIVLHLSTYKKLLKFLCGSRPSQQFVNIEENIFNALHDIPTLTEITVLALYAQAVGRPYMRHVRSGSYNALNLGPFHSQVKKYCKSVIQNSELLLAPEAALKNATLDGQIWDQPEVIYAVLYQVPHLPNIRSMLVAFFEGALKAWERFTSEFTSDGTISQATPEQRQSAWITPTNDASEGALGQCRQMLRRAPTMSDEQRNARVMWPRHSTYEWKKQNLTDDDEKFIRREARVLDSSGVNRKIQTELHNALEERVEANTLRLAKLQERRSKRRDKLAPVEVMEDATYEQLLSMKVKDLDLQIDRLREEGDKCIRAKSMAPTKLVKIQEILKALKRRRADSNEILEPNNIENGVGVGKDVVPESDEDDWPDDADMYFKDEVIF